MSTTLWLLAIALIIGLIVGGIAIWAAQGRGLVAYLVAALVGSVLFLYISMFLFRDVTDPLAAGIVASIIGSIIFAGVTRALVVK